MSKAAWIADQIGFLWQITCKHRVSNLAQKHSFATAEKLHVSWMGFGSQPSHPTRSTFTSNHFTALLPQLPGKLSAEIKRWGYPHGSKVLKIPDRQFSHEIPVTNSRDEISLTVRNKCSGRRQQHSQEYQYMVRLSVHNFLASKVYILHPSSLCCK